MMKLFIFLVFALTVFARESLLSSKIRELVEESLAEHEFGVTDSLFMAEDEVSGCKGCRGHGCRTQSGGCSSVTNPLVFSIL